MKKNSGNDPYGNRQPQTANRGNRNAEVSFDNTSYDDEELSMDASAFVNRHCNFAEASMMTNELAHSQNNMN